MRLRLLAILFALALLAVACGEDPATTASDDTTDAPAAVTEDTATDPATDDDAESGDAEAASTVAVSSTDLGDVLVDGEGVTLYLFDNDEQGESTCYDDCESNWPPLEGPASAGEGADDSQLGTVEREDGTTQVTYNGWPLYYFAGDEQAGDVNGQGVGEVWWAVTADGKRAGEGGGDDAAREY